MTYSRWGVHENFKEANSRGEQPVSFSSGRGNKKKCGNCLEKDLSWSVACLGPVRFPSSMQLDVRTVVQKPRDQCHSQFGLSMGLKNEKKNVWNSTIPPTKNQRISKYHLKILRFNMKFNYVVGFLRGNSPLDTSPTTYPLWRYYHCTALQFRSRVLRLVEKPWCGPVQCQHS